MAKISKRISKDRLKKIIHVLYPEYKYIKVKNDLSAVLYKKKWWLQRLFSKKDKVPYSMLISYYIPKKLTLLKYDNKDFFGVVVGDMTAAELRKEDLISYLYTEIVKVKYPHVFNKFAVPEITSTDPEDEEYEEDEDLSFITRRTTEKVNRAVKQTYLMTLQTHPLYYEYMVIGAITLVILCIILFG